MKLLDLLSLRDPGINSGATQITLLINKLKLREHGEGPQQVGQPIATGGRAEECNRGRALVVVRRSAERAEVELVHQLRRRELFLRPVISPAFEPALQRGAIR